MQPHHTTQPQTLGNDTTAQDLTISAGKAQLLSMLYFLPLAILFGLSYILLWPNKFGKAAYQGALPDNLSSTTMLALFIAVIFAGIVVHELIHGITWSMFAKKGFRSMKFGVLWKSFTPYCHCTEPLRVGHYITGALMPALVLGIVPLVISLIKGNILVFSFGIFFTLAAGGDFLIVSMLRKVDAGLLVQDHPSKIGCLLHGSDGAEVNP